MKFDTTEIREVPTLDPEFFENNDLDTAIELRDIGMCDSFTNAILKGGFDLND